MGVCRPRRCRWRLFGERRREFVKEHADNSRRHQLRKRLFANLNKYVGKTKGGRLIRLEERPTFPVYTYYRRVKRFASDTGQRSQALGQRYESVCHVILSQVEVFREVDR